MHDTAPRWSPAQLAYGFYGVAAAGAVIGQTWVALTHVPWNPGIPGWVRVAAVLPFALCLELLAMALAAMGDERRRLGERAYGYRIFSALVATIAVGILVVGHWPHYYWSAAFGVLSTSAYMLWLLHSAARRRDALRAAGKLADTAPDYGLWRRLRHPIWTARAAELARQGHTDPSTQAWRPLGLYESLRAAQLAIDADKRRPALAKAVEQVVRAEHPDPKMADVAVHTLNLDRIATELEALVDYTAWADRLAPGITTPTTQHHENKPQDPPMPANSTRGATGHPARTRRPNRPTRIVRRSWAEAQPVAPQPISQEKLADRAAVPAPVHERTEQPRDGTPADNADTIAALPMTSSIGDHHRPTPVGLTTADDAGTDSGETVNAHQVAPEPVDETIAAAPSVTAAAVAFWRDRHPELRPAEIATRVGRSERQVRRVLARLDDNDITAPDSAAVRDLTDAHR